MTSLSLELPSRSRRHLWLGAIVATAIGQGSAAAAVAVWGPPAGAEASILGPATFAAVWSVLFPCFGVAAAHVWATTATANVRVAALSHVAAVGWALVCWMPLACVARSAWVPVIGDVLAIGLVLGLSTHLRTVEPPAVRWLVPVMVWLPLSFAISSLAAV